MDVKTLQKKNKEIRRKIIEILAEARGGHYGGSLSCVEVLSALYLKEMRIDPQKPDWADRDRFVLSKGHACASFCTVLAERGYFSGDLLQNFNQLNSPFGMHPDMHKIPGCDVSTGSLGHGLPIGIGMALAGRMDQKNYRVFVLLGDGECQEGVIWEGMMAAAHFKLDNLVAIIDRNMVSMDGFTEEIMSLGDLRKKMEAFGWAVREVDGHNIEEILEALQAIPFAPGKPSGIIALTTKGKGVCFMENCSEWHHKEASPEETERALKELE